MIYICTAEDKNSIHYIQLILLAFNENLNYSIRTCCSLIQRLWYSFEMQSSPEVVLISYSAFKSVPPNEFRVTNSGPDNTRLPDNTKVTIISDKEELTNTSKTNIVKTASDLEGFRNQILNRPLLLFVICGRHVPLGQRYVLQLLLLFCKFCC